MGGCISTSRIEVTDADKELHRKAEKSLKETKVKMASQVKLLLLGTGDSGKSTILKQMRLIHKVAFTEQEIEFFRQLTFDNLTRGLKYLLDAMIDLDLAVSPENEPYLELIALAPDLHDGQFFPIEYLEPLRALWEDPNVQAAWKRGNEIAPPDNLPYFFSSLDRLFDPKFKPTELDIVQCRVRTIGITETVFNINSLELIMIDVGGQKSERRKWIHCFQDVKTILFLVNLNGYDQCLVEDKTANQMQDAMTVWDGICHSQWFKHTALILFLNKNDLFEQKILHSDIKNFFPDFEGQVGEAKAGRDYFKRRFIRLAQSQPDHKERDIYVHTTTATDTRMLRTILSAVEDMIVRTNLRNIL